MSLQPNRGLSMEAITFDVKGEPKGQPRVHAFARKMGTKYVARMYTPDSANDWKGNIGYWAREHIPADPISVPVRVRLECNFTRPKSHFGTGKNASTLKPAAPTCHTTKPDFDNVAKAALDALVNIGMLKDDCLVAEATVVKRYANGQPSTRITIEPLTQAGA